MAFNISVVRDGAADFSQLQAAAESLDRRSVTVFPIAANAFNNEQGVGLSIGSDADPTALWPPLQSFLEQAAATGFRVIELYGGTDVTNQLDVLRHYLE